jgi:hypothetical protein
VDSQGSPPPPDPAAAGTEEGRVQSLDARFAAQDAKIDGLGGKLDDILGRLGGSPKGPTGGSGSASGSPSPEPGGKSIADQIREGVDRIEAEKTRKAKAKADGDAAEARLRSIEQRLPERPPADPAPGRKRGLQRILFGAEAARR